MASSSLSLTHRSAALIRGGTMGLFDKLKPKSPLEKAAKQVKEVYAQPDYRRAAMDKLAVEGSTGFVRDNATHLKGDTSALLSIDRALEKLDVYRLLTEVADWIADAKLVLTDELIKADLAARGAPSGSDEASGDTP